MNVENAGFLLASSAPAPGIVALDYPFVCSNPATNQSFDVLISCVTNRLKHLVNNFLSPLIIKQLMQGGLQIIL